MSGKKGRVAPTIKGETSDEFLGRQKGVVGIGRSPSSLVRGIQLSHRRASPDRVATAAEILHLESLAYKAGLPVPPILPWQLEHAVYALKVEGDMLPALSLRARHVIRGWNSPPPLQDLPNVLRKDKASIQKQMRKALEGDGKSGETEEGSGDGESSEMASAASHRGSGTFRGDDRLWGSVRSKLLGEVNESPVKWAKLKFYRPDLVTPQSRKKKLARNFRRSDQGERIGEIWKVATDGEIFSDCRPTLGGSLLIDCSGSMGMEAATVERIVVNAPRMVIAKYGGHLQFDHARQRWDEVKSYGWLQIVAHKGCLARQGDLLATYGARNLCDGLALEWLAEQPSPRFWYSDGQATDHHEGNIRTAGIVCERLCKIHNIHRINSLSELSRYLRVEI